MSPVRSPVLGSVGWAEIKDPNGYGKLRPVVIVSPTADIDSGNPVRVVAITTRLPDPLPDDHVLLPWDHQGKVRSGLRRRCAAVSSWQAEIAVTDMQQVIGILPPRVINEILHKISSALNPPSSASAPGNIGSADRSTGEAETKPASAAEDPQGD